MVVNGDLPFNQNGLKNDCLGLLLLSTTNQIELSGTGDARADENMALTGIHSLYLRNHNRIATWLQTEHPNWTDEELFQKARDINIGTFQQQVYEEYLPEVFRTNFIEKYLGDYKGYHSSVDPRITSSFNIAFRAAHSTISLPPYIITNDCTLYKLNGTRGFPSETNANCIFHTYRLLGTKAILQSVLVQRAQEVTGKISDLMRNIVFYGPDSFCDDIETLNIIRGREFKTKNFNGLREYWVGESLYGLEQCTRQDPMDPIECFNKINKNNTLAALFQEVFKHVDEIDSFIGLLLEDTGNDGKFGETASAIILDQFKRARSADPNYYVIFPYSQDELDFVNESIGDLLEENYNILGIKNALKSAKLSKFCPSLSK
jgi:hypothetical protein